jgi:O-antigen ligase
MASSVPHPAPIPALMGVLALALSLLGNPGVTGSVPALTFCANGVLLVSSALLLWRQGWTPVPRIVALGALLGLIGLAGIPSSYAPYLSSLGTAGLAGFLGMTTAFELGVSNRQQWRIIVPLLVLVATVSSSYGIYRWFALGQSEALTSTFTNADCYSLIPLLGFFWSLGLAVERPGRLRVLCALAALPLLMALVLTASRAGLLGLATGYATFLVTLSSSRSQSLRTTAGKLFVLPLVLGLMLAIAGSNLQLVDKLTRLSQGNDPVAIQSRLDVVRNCYKTIARRPWQGSGIGCFHLAYQQDRTALSAGEDYMNVAHNDYVQWFVETGIPGGLCWVAILGTSFLTAWRSYKSPTPWAAAQVATVVGIATYCAFNFAYPVAADLLWIGAAFGLCGALPRLDRVSTEAPWRPRSFPVALLLAAWGVSTVQFGLLCFMVQRQETAVARAEEGLAWEEAFAKIQKGAQLQPENFRLHLKSAEIAKKVFLFTGQDQWLETEGSALKKAYDENPRDLQVLLTLISFLEGRAQPQQATPYIAEAERLAPYSTFVRRARARNQILLGQFPAAAATLMSIERTGLPANDPTLAILLYTLEAKKATSGKEFLRKIGTENPDRAADLAMAAAVIGREAKDYPPALRLLQQARYLATRRADVRLEAASLLGLSGDDEAELKALDKLRADTVVEMDEATQERTWKRWAELQTKKGQFDLVLTRLDDYLITHQRQLWPRVLMAEIHLKRSENAEARAALREGIPYDTDGTLRIQLADLCASQGLNELARSYYKEALRVSNKKAEIEERLTRVKPTQDELEEVP